MRLSVTVVSLMLVFTFAGCSRNDGGKSPAVEKKKPPPVTPPVVAAGEKDKAPPTTDVGTLPAIEKKKTSPTLPVAPKAKQPPTTERPAVYGKGVLTFRAYELDRFKARASKLHFLRKTKNRPLDG